MKIVFVRPFARLNQFILMPPLNYLHLAGYLREQGHESLIVDQIFPECGQAHLDQLIRTESIALVGIGCMTCEFQDAVTEARRLKEVHAGLKIVFGGPHPSADPDECLSTGVVDYVAVGEGELPLTQLMDAMQKGEPTDRIEGLWVACSSGSVNNGAAPVPEIDQLPRPAYDLVSLEPYYKLNLPWHFPKYRQVVPFISSRGCPYRCSYCHTLHGKRYRGQSPELVLDTLEWLVKEKGVREFMMVDDIFNFDLERAKRICRGIIERKLEIALQFPNGVRGDRFDEELVELMAKAGCHFMAVAIETISPKFQKLIRKNLKIEKARETVVWARKNGIEVSGFFMIGFPGETTAEIQETLDFAVAAPFDNIFINIVTPYKGTSLRTDMLEGRFGQVDAEAIAALDEVFPTVPDNVWTREDLIRMQRAAYWRFYLKPNSLLSITKKLGQWRNWKKFVGAIRRRVVMGEALSVN